MAGPDRSESLLGGVRRRLPTLLAVAGLVAWLGGIAFLPGASQPDILGRPTQWWVALGWILLASGVAVGFSRGYSRSER
jgi:hypothetical protein